ncbi:Subtilisin-like protease [Rhynchospora pubera]|uniref:Subtilisin-like protease n=1 Tax=Rhynchospora pubera TaxID=906938 RepID=A0AAV8BQG9_9POAL|nr:Subtilisin-like protease [Rhynchospora pubera]
MDGRKLTLLSFILIVTITQACAQKKSYIVYLGHHPHGSDATIEDHERAKTSHYNLLASYLGSDEQARDAIFYSYTNHINGFAASMEEKEAKELAKHPDVLSVFPNKIYKLHTTRSWSFMDMMNNMPTHRGSNKADLGRNVIIATLDTGVWPESKSFSEEGMGPIPSKWRGSCEDKTKNKVHCNRKLIGAKYFYKGILAISPNENVTDSARDDLGHGTHTLSTAAGSFVPSANFFGYANGTAHGGAPDAHVAAYKVCWAAGCSNADILAAFDTALHDNVDILSLSLGSGPSFSGGTDFLNDAIALGSLHAVSRGATVVCSAGNQGPGDMSINNAAPWIVTVAASTIDRDYPSFLKLGDHHIIKASSQESESLPQNKLYPFISGSDAAAPGLVNVTQAKLCNTSSLDPEKVKGKIVVCMRDLEIARVQKGMTVKDAGGAGMVLVNNEYWGDLIIADPHVLPATMITYNDSFTLFSYLKDTKNPKGNISPKDTRIGDQQAPAMAEFSSRGPSYVTPQVLKPDVTAPGVNILAAFTELVSPTGLDDDKRRTPYAFLSGTSMSCPHVSGVAGLLKAAHPDWSAAAIKSAIMTTARTKDNKHMPMRDLATGNEATPFAYGNGHVRPNRASDPGLVYDTKFEDYLKFLCTLGFNSTYLRGFTHDKHFDCPSKPMMLENLNYPSISVGTLNTTIVVTRTLKNVGPAGTYHVRVDAPPRVEVVVKPKVLVFPKVGEEKEYSITMTSRIKDKSQEGYKFGRLMWTDGKHHVRSAIVVNVASS